MCFEGGEKDSGKACFGQGKKNIKRWSYRFERAPNGIANGTLGWDNATGQWVSGKGECEEFIYDGCGGTSNNFETKEFCMKTCKLEERPPPPGAHFI